MPQATDSLIVRDLGLATTSKMPTQTPQNRERRSQSRGLLLLATVVLLYLLHRAHPLNLFATNWWHP